LRARQWSLILSDVNPYVTWQPAPKNPSHGGDPPAVPFRLGFVVGNVQVNIVMTTCI